MIFAGIKELNFTGKELSFSSMDSNKNDNKSSE